MGRSRELAEQLIALADAGDRDGFAALLTEDCELVVPGMTLRGREQVGDFGRNWDRAFSGGGHAIRVAVESGDTDVLELRWTGTHTGPLTTPMGEIAATGTPVVLDHAMVVRARGDLVASAHVYFDSLGFMGQFGVGAQPEPAAASA
jgi:ketosteroid isomerase-like protein